MSYRCTVCEGCESSDGSEFLSVNESEYEWWFSEEESEHEDIEGKPDEVQSKSDNAYPNKKKSETVNEGSSGDENYAENEVEKSKSNNNYPKEINNGSESSSSSDEDLPGNKNYVGIYDKKKKKPSKSNDQKIEYVAEPPRSDDDSASENDNDEGNEKNEKSKYPKEIEDVITNEVASNKAIIKKPSENSTLSGNENPPDNKNGKEEPTRNEVEEFEEVEDVLVKEVSAPTMLAYGHQGGRYRPSRQGNSGRRRRPRGSSGRYRRPYYKRQKRHARRHIWTTSVNMPTGKPQNVTVPVKPGMKWKCGDKSKLINLNPNGKMGKKEFDIVSNEMKNSSTGQKYTVTKVEKIVNACLWKRYRYRKRIITEECGQANERFLFHGSSAIKNLVDIGLDERYANINGWFGAGIYFGCNSNKSHGYTGGTGQMLLCRVLLGKLEQVTAGVHKAHATPGYHSLEGLVALPEFVVYRGEQVYPEYLITYT